MPTRVVVFAKAPVPGKVKTRLAVTIGAEPAAVLAQRMLEHTIRTALAAAVGPVELCGSPAQHPLLQAVATYHRITLSDQSGGDLGDRMATAFRRVLAAGMPALLIGTDCPGLSPASLQHAAGALQEGCDASFIPSLDGGYVLIGLRRFAPELFDDMAWSSAVVMTQTRRQLHRLGWQWWEGEALADIDDADDLAHLPATWRPFQ